MKKGIQLVALLLTVVMTSCTGGKDKAALKQEDEKPRVKVADVTARPVDQIQDYTATVEAEVKNNIAPSSPVRIDQIFVEVGDRVSKGQKLVQMDAANLTQTKLQLDNQKIEFNRIDELYKVGGASKSEWDASKMQLDVKKTAYVYLPYGYSEEKEYNILYLMHGTGDDEKYWLKTNPYNKTMLDNMIADGDIEPLIVVTPTFYVEDDCADDLDQLTYSFAKELRNDLMPEIESSYSTYAKSADDKGFSKSRDHRAFAGLSRGAVTMYHSVLCQSLDYFSWFGAFSGSRTDKTAFEDTIQTGDFAELPIHYLYVASGNLDFALPGQIQDYQALLDIELRLRSGVNTCFDVFPMRYHSMGNWHLALYNFLQKIF